MLTLLTVLQTAVAQAVAAFSPATMEPPSPEPTPPPPEQELPPLLPCIQFLNTHFQNGGMDTKAYTLLYRMIQMMSAIGYEAGVIFSAKNPLPSSEAAIEYYLQRLQEGVQIFRAIMLQPWRKARRATNSLPELEENDCMLETKWRHWYWKLRTLHELTGNDERLFRLVKQHFYQEAYQRLHHLHLARPQYGLARIAHQAAQAYMSLDQVELIAWEADEMIRALDKTYRSAAHTLRIRATNPCVPEEAIISSPELLASDTYEPPNGQLSLHPNPLCSKSFGVAEEELIKRGHARASTFTETDYTTSEHRDSLAQQSPSLLSIGVAKRRGVTNGLRVFTGSFSQLEDDIRRLRIDKVKTPETPSIQGYSDPVRVRDFGATPATSPSTISSPISPQRREGLVSRDAGSQDCLINGEVITKRWPSNTRRSRTIDDSTGGLEAWLNEVSDSTQSPNKNESMANGVPHRHREHTI